MRKACGGPQRTLLGRPALRFLILPSHLSMICNRRMICNRCDTEDLRGYRANERCERCVGLRTSRRSAADSAVAMAPYGRCCPTWRMTTDASPSAGTEGECGAGTQSRVFAKLLWILLSPLPIRFTSPLHLTASPQSFTSPLHLKASPESFTSKLHRVQNHRLRLKLPGFASKSPASPQKASPKKTPRLRLKNHRLRLTNHPGFASNYPASPKKKGTQGMVSARAGTGHAVRELLGVACGV